EQPAADHQHVQPADPRHARQRSAPGAAGGGRTGAHDGAGARAPVPVAHPVLDRAGRLHRRAVRATGRCRLGGAARHRGAGRGGAGRDRAGCRGAARPAAERA
nr:hypothetical protein [Tanacetum cinerariifolium]